MKLPPRPWQRLPGAARIFAALDTAGGTTRIVGGAVRDALLGLDVADVDLATRLLPEEIVRRVEAAGLKAVPTGIAHGTVTVVAPDLHVEVTTLRHDVETDGRRAVVAFTDDWRADASRRDFTINALYADPHTLEIVDFFGGIEDALAGRIRFIGDPLVRIAEDHLRILRLFRFHARFGRGPIDAAGLAAATRRANDLKALSRERIRDELLKLLATNDPCPVVETMIAAGIFAPVLPEVGSQAASLLRRLVEREKAAAITPAGLRRLAALLPADPALADAIAARLRLSNAERKRLTAVAARGEGEPGTPEALAYAVGVDAAIDRLLLGPDDPAAASRLVQWQRPRLALTGGDLIAAGLAPGPAVSTALRAVENEWIAAGFPPGRDWAMAAARRWLDGRQGG